MSYLKEIMQFLFAVAIAGGLGYVYFNYLSPWRDPNKKLKENSEKWVRNRETVSLNVHAQQQRINEHVDRILKMAKEHAWMGVEKFNYKSPIGLSVKPKELIEMVYEKTNGSVKGINTWADPGQRIDFVIQNSNEKE